MLMAIGEGPLPTQVVLGLNCSHDAAASIIHDGRLLVGIAEERLTRKKHQSGLPRKAIDYCMNVAQLNSFKDIDMVVINQQPPTDV